MSAATATMVIARGSLVLEGGLLELGCMWHYNASAHEQLMNRIYVGRDVCNFHFTSGSCWSTDTAAC